MAKNFIQPGQVITISGETSPIKSGDVYNRGGIIGVATGGLSADDIASGKDEWEMALGGVWSFKAAASLAPAFGAVVSFVTASSEVDAVGDIEVGPVVRVEGDQVHVLVNNRGEASGY